MEKYFQIYKCDLKNDDVVLKDCYLLSGPDINPNFEIDLTNGFFFNADYKVENRRLAGYSESFDELVEFCKERDINIPVECIALPKEFVALGGKLQVGGERDYILNEKLVALGWSNDLLDNKFATNARRIETICKTLSVGDYIKITIYDCCTGPCKVLEIYDGGIRVEMVDGMYTLCYENSHLESRALSAEYSEIAEIVKLDTQTGALLARRSLAISYLERDDLDAISKKEWQKEITEVTAELAQINVSNEFMEDEIYPLTIVSDRYTGAYSGGQYTAWNLSANELPDGIDGDDVDCMSFWRNNTIPVGKGRTVSEALANLYIQLNNDKVADEADAFDEDVPW